MHFKVTMTVRLTSPVHVEDAGGGDGGQEENATHFLVVLGVNAEDVGVAAGQAQEEVLDDVEGRVEEAEIVAIDEGDLDDEALRDAPLDQPGVFFKSGRAYFSEHDSDTKRWWQFWR